MDTGINIWNSQLKAETDLIWGYLRTKFEEEIPDNYKEILKITLKSSILGPFDQFYDTYKDWNFISTNKNSIWTKFVLIFFDSEWILERINKQRQNIQFLSDPANFGDSYTSLSGNQTGNEQFSSKTGGSKQTNTGEGKGKNLSKQADSDNNSLSSENTLLLNEEIIGNQYTHQNSEQNQLNYASFISQVLDTSTTKSLSNQKGYTSTLTNQNKVLKLIQTLQYEMPMLRNLFWRQFLPLFDKSAF